MKTLIAVCIMLATIVSVWWWTLAHIHESAEQMALYRTQIAGLQEQVKKTEEALARVEGLRNEIAEVRRENQNRLLEAMGLYGNDRLDYLERLLREDAQRRAAGAPVAPTAGANGAVH